MRLRKLPGFVGSWKWDWFVAVVTKTELPTVALLSAATDGAAAAAAKTFTSTIAFASQEDAASSVAPTS